MELSKDMSKKGVSTVNGTDDREAHSKFWIAAYTRPRGEKKLSLELDKQGIENYLPTQIRISQWSDRKKKIEMAVIPMLIFIRISRSQELQIKKKPLVLRILTLPGNRNIAAIPDEDIKKLKFILGQSDIPVSIDMSALPVNEDVRILRGPLMGIKGKVIETSADESEVLVNLHVLGGARIKIKRINLERIGS